MNPILESDLSGLWDFAPENNEKTQILVPGGGWLKQGFDCEAATYSTWITIPDAGMPQVTLLEFGAVNHLASVFIGEDEGALVNIHEEVTSFTGQTIDLTQHVLPGQSYLLRIRVRSHQNGKPLAPHAANWCECIARGIFRSVRLCIYPAVYIQDAFVKTSISSRTFRYEVWIVNASDCDRTLELSAKLSSCDADSLLYPTLPSNNTTVKAKCTLKAAIGPLDWTLGSDSYWWPNIPYRENYRTKLHRLAITVSEGITSIHTASVRFGFREIRQAGRYYELNGFRINFRGDNLQVANYDRIDCGGCGDAIDTLPGFLPPSSGNPGWPRAVDHFLRLNFNVQREHMGPWTPYMLDVCDEMGLMVIGESAARLNGFDRVDGVCPHERKCLQDIVKRDRSHPSIIRWSTVNEPQNNDPRYHLDLYDAVKAIDDTRPISEDIWSVDYLTKPLRDVFGLLMDKADFTWIEHYLSFDDVGVARQDAFAHNDAVIALTDRPYGLGEANLDSISSHAQLACSASTVALCRVQGASDVRPYVLSSAWGSSIPGVLSNSFIAEEGRHPVYGEDNLPDPWNNRGILLLRHACSPVFAMDVDFWRRNRKSNAAGAFPADVPKIQPSSLVKRQIAVFNDLLQNKNLILQWAVYEGSFSNPPVAQGSENFTLQAGSCIVSEISFETPDAESNKKYIYLALDVYDCATKIFEDRYVCFELERVRDGNAMIVF